VESLLKYCFIELKILAEARLHGCIYLLVKTNGNKQNSLPSHLCGG
jgi:hypothetical protein